MKKMLQPRPFLVSVDIRVTDKDKILQEALKLHLNYTKYVTNFHIREDSLIIATKYSIKILHCHTYDRRTVPFI